jgi:hypothetical protein
MVRQVPVGCVEVRVRHAEASEDYLLGWFPLDPQVLEALPKTLKKFGLSGDVEWTNKYATQFYASDNAIVFEIIMEAE